MALYLFSHIYILYFAGFGTFLICSFKRPHYIIYWFLLFSWPWCNLVSSFWFRGIHSTLSTHERVVLACSFCIKLKIMCVGFGRVFNVIIISFYKRNYQLFFQHFCLLSLAWIIASPSQTRLCYFKNNHIGK